MLPVRTPRHRRTPPPASRRELVHSMRRPDRDKHTGQPGKAEQRAQHHSQGARLAHSQGSCPGRRALAASGQRPQRAGRWQQHRRRHLDGLRQVPHLPTLDPAPAGIQQRKEPPRWSSTPPRPWPTTRPGVGRNAARQSGWTQTPWGRSTETSRSHSGMW